MQILRFTSRTPDEIKQAISELTAQSVKSFVLDVRNNPGGLLQESIEVAQVFLNGGTIAYERSRTSEKAFNAADNTQLTNLPMVVLINNNTASAAEIVAIALKDRGRAIAIGQKSYGKGSVQLIFQLSDKSALHVTTAEWLSPNKTVLDGKGIEPDISMIPDENGRDVELGEAVRYLRDKTK
jgi:carboxyl-terminal processing protease